VHTGFFGGETEEKRLLGRPRHRWEENIKLKFQEVDGGCKDWIYLTQDMDT
jgi:hypothetical protein